MIKWLQVTFLLFPGLLNAADNIGLCFLPSEVVDIEKASSTMVKKLSTADVIQLKRDWYAAVGKKEIKSIDRATSPNFLFRNIRYEQDANTLSRLEYLLSAAKWFKQNTRFLASHIIHEKVTIADNGLWAVYEADVVEKVWQWGSTVVNDLHEKSYVILDKGKPKYAAMCYFEKQPAKITEQPKSNSCGDDKRKGPLQI